MTIKPTDQKEYEVLQKIEFLRKEMMYAGIHQGLTSEKTLKISRKLDIYIEKYLLMKKSI